jgi:hypothetical protein
MQYGYRWSMSLQPAAAAAKNATGDAAATPAAE